MKRQLPIFVYGTLLEGFLNHQRYVKPYAHQAFPAEIKGEIYDLPTGYPGLLAGDDMVKGAVLVFSPEVYEEALAGLDELETYYGPGDPRNEYDRQQVAARISGKEKEEMVYVYRYVDEEYVRGAGTRVFGGDWRLFTQDRQAE